MPNHDHHTRRAAGQPRTRALSDVVREIPNAIRASLDRYYQAFSDDVAAARKNVERHVRTVVLDFIRWNTDGISVADGSVSAVRHDEILVAAVAQLTVWHELHPESTRYQRPPPANHDTAELDVESWLSGVEGASGEDERGIGEVDALSRAEDAQFDFDGLNQAVLAWSRARAPLRDDVVAVEAHGATAAQAEPAQAERLSAGYGRLRREVFGLARRLIHNEDDAAEIYQESLKGLAKQYAGGRPSGRGLVADLKTILRRRVVDFIRKELGTVKPGRVRERGRGRLRPVTNGPDLHKLASPSTRAVDELLEEQDQLRVFIEHVLVLPPRQGELLIGEFVDELGKQELPIKVERVLGIAVEMSVVYAERKKALAVLAEQLTRTGWSFPRLYSPRRSQH